MIRQQQLKQRFPSGLHFRGRRLNLHPLLEGSNACGGINALSGDIDYADAADADGLLILLMAKRGNRNSALLCGFEDRGRFIFGLLDDVLFSIEREVNLLGIDKCC